MPALVEKSARGNPESRFGLFLDTAEEIGVKAFFKWPLVVAAMLLRVAGAARADLTLVEPQDFPGTGLGAVNRVLTLKRA